MATYYIIIPSNSTTWDMCSTWDKKIHFKLIRRNCTIFEIIKFFFSLSTQDYLRSYCDNIAQNTNNNHGELFPRFPPFLHSKGSSKTLYR